LKEGWIAGAGLDDIEEEPAKQRDWKPENPLFSLDNVVITPHAAYYSEESVHTVRDFAAREVVRVLTGQPPHSPVNAAQLAVARPATWPRLSACCLFVERRGRAEDGAVAFASVIIRRPAHYRWVGRTGCPGMTSSTMKMAPAWPASMGSSPMRD